MKRSSILVLILPGCFICNLYTFSSQLERAQSSAPISFMAKQIVTYIYKRIKEIHGIDTRKFNIHLKNKKTETCIKPLLCFSLQLSEHISRKPYPSVSSFNQAPFIRTLFFVRNLGIFLHA